MHYDGAMWWDRSLNPSPLHGVDHPCGNRHSGHSLAPVTAGDLASLVDMFCFIEDIPVPAVADAVPWTWSLGPSTATLSINAARAANIAPKWVITIFV